MDDGERDARERLEMLFRTFDRLTPGELARIGFQPAADEEREALLDAIDEAAERTGRVALVDDARRAARDAVLGRYSSGSLHPTFAGLNWGLSQGTVESRVAIAQTLSDAAAAAVVEDALDPEIAAALALDAAAITDLAAGEAAEGSLAQALRHPQDPELRPGRSTTMGRRAAAFTMLVLVAIAGGVGAIWVAIAGFLAGVRAIARIGRRRDR